MGIQIPPGPDLGAWVGRRETSIDRVTASRLAAWNAMLDRDDPFPADGLAAAPGFHWTLFNPLARQSDLGVDGHPMKGLFLPPIPLPRRMWAGGRLAFHRPLLVGEPVERVSLIERLEEKHGRSGHLFFVTLRHTISGPSGVAIEEEQDLVYRESPSLGSKHEEARPGEQPPPAAWRRRIPVDEVLLFRYSALTFNGHRIHYDRQYAMVEEGYPGLVVHAPLIATLLLDLVRREAPTCAVKRFVFRAVRPTFDTGAFAVEGAPGEDPGRLRLWSTDDGGRVGVEAEAWAL